eukprot:m.36113 g.36113  ORF g.36113 m.36113 type:complete len:276 (+) comp44487_c0_seq1:60-887(+)
MRIWRAGGLWSAVPTHKKQETKRRFRAVCPIVSVLVMLACGLLLLSVAYAQTVHSLVPLYAYPTSAALTAEWDVIASMCSTVPTLVIMNPDNGDGDQCPPNLDWINALNSVAGCGTLGYVYTNYGDRPLDEVQEVIDSYLQCWDVNGIFVDETSNVAADLPYYTSVYNYIKSKNESLLVTLNPGSVTPEAYANISDILVLFEDYGANWQDFQTPSFVSSYPPSKFSALLHYANGTVTVAQAKADIALGLSRGFEWMYVLDSNNYADIPSFYRELF